MFEKRVLEQVKAMKGLYEVWLAEKSAKKSAHALVTVGFNCAYVPIFRFPFSYTQYFDVIIHVIAHKMSIF